jgi:hypothetical protein
MPFSRTPGIADPDELKALESVFDKACRTSKITRGSADAENIALKIMLLFQSGVDDPGQLLEAAIVLPDADEVQADYSATDPAAGSAARFHFALYSQVSFPTLSPMPLQELMLAAGKSSPPALPGEPAL